MISAYAYNANRFKQLPGEDMRRFNTLFDMINYNISFVDRTGGIKVPIRTKTPSQLSMPVFDPTFSMTYEECCQARVRDILARQEQLDVPIRLLYSGGIDSSLILVSFIKELGVEQAANRIQLVMSQESIEENPWMYEKLIRRGNFDMISGELHSRDWGRDRILVGGEFNDQILGSDVYRDLTRWKGDGILEQPWTADLMTEYYLSKGLSTADSEMWTGIFGDHLKRAPCAVENVADWWWWINFSCKWGSVYFRILMYAQAGSDISQEYLDGYYYQFYGDDRFQQWSMVDRTYKHQGTWLTYKWLAKRLVSDFLGDDQYMQKIKRGSLWRLLGYKKSAEIINEYYQYDWNCTAADWYDPDNSFGETS